jgi:flagellin-like hook-associated protein FlgL
LLFKKLQADVENLAVVESRIRDADIATKSAELVKYLTRQQSAIAVLVPANQMPKLALKLLEL